MSAPKINISEVSDRLARTKAWDADISRLRFAKGARAEALNHMGLENIQDVLHHIPHRYLDFTHIVKIALADVGSDATIVGTVDRVNLKRPKPKFSLTEVALVDESGVLFCTFFNQPWLSDHLRKGDIMAVSGKVEFKYNYRRMVPQFHEVIGEAGQEKVTYARVLPIHSLSEGISAAWMRRIESAALADYGDGCDFMPAELVAKNHLMTEARALREAHFPTSLASARRARKRLAYDELMSLQTALLARQAIELEGITPHVHNTHGAHLQAMTEALPFTLTDEQQTALDEVLEDMASERPMNRLLLGDVGTGKTAVAALALACVADGGTQGAVMAPTSVLAHQYADKLGSIFDAAHISWALITGATLPAERAQLAQQIADGSISVVFGTTALLSGDITFKDLSLVVVDEQHRFGVEQRSALRTKGMIPDQLVMTATPIPRTLALSVYGDLSRSLIKNRPHPGAGVETKLITLENADLAYIAIRDAVERGQQAYVVCPLVEDTDDESELEDVPEAERTKAQPHSATSVYEHLSQVVFADLSVGLITGRMSAAAKDGVMGRFRSGEIQILVSTTVIEVGVDVPNATVMMIWDADRFGLATLHQLRGRVGRGTVSGSVYLVSAARPKSPAARRLSTLTKTNDGLALAEMDLQMRHEGEVLGIRQSGGVTLHLVDLATDIDLIEAAYADARLLNDQDPSLSLPENKPFAREVRRRFGTFFEGERSR